MGEKLSERLTVRLPYALSQRLHVAVPPREAGRFVREAIAAALARMSS